MLKKFFSMSLIIALMSGSAYAAMPADTILFTDLGKATSTKNIDFDALLSELDDADKNDVFYKYDDTSWINVDDPSRTVDIDDFPVTTYYDKDGTKTIYDKHDGDEMTDSFYIENID